MRLKSNTKLRLVHLPPVLSLCVLSFTSSHYQWNSLYPTTTDFSPLVTWLANVQLVNDMSDCVVLLANARSGALKHEQRKGSISGEQVQQLFL